MGPCVAVWDQEGGVSEGGSRLNPTALPIINAAKLLSAAGGARVTAEMIEKDARGGAPDNASLESLAERYNAAVVVVCRWNRCRFRIEHFQPGKPGS